LNPNQLVRKRAHDREAQRNIRQRTRDHIENLERQIQELSRDQQNSRNLEAVERRNIQLEEEVGHLREVLSRHSESSMSSMSSSADLVPSPGKWGENLLFCARKSLSKWKASWDLPPILLKTAGLTGGIQLDMMDSKANTLIHICLQPGIHGVHRSESELPFLSQHQTQATYGHPLSPTTPR